jgi:hypothetical protein
MIYVDVNLKVGAGKLSNISHVPQFGGCIETLIIY